MIVGWILVLTLTTPQGVAIDHVPGFNSLEDCTNAGLTWATPWATKGYENAHFVCLMQK
jgi:hypothetical protein